MHYIYCYINKINQHKYVGQTNNIKRRCREHISSSYNKNSCSYDALFHKKIRQYGIENFDFKILETIYEDDQNIVNEREIYWIDKLESFRGTGKGYNSDRGGSQAKECKVLTEKQLKEVKEKIKQGEAFPDIAAQYEISVSFISGINHGTYWKDKHETYPLFKYYKDDSDYDELIDLLLQSELSFREIAEQLGIAESTVKKINYGTLRKDLYPNHPIRTITPIKKKANKVKDLLLNTSLTYKQIKEMVGVSNETIRCINIGKTHHDDNLKYPLRKNL